MKITEEEYEAIVDELAERIIDIIHVRAKERIKEAISHADLETWLELGGGNDPIEVTYVIRFVVNDFMQILQRLRRKGGKYV